jgi:hypothetical protein
MQNYTTRADMPLHIEGNEINGELNNWHDNSYAIGRDFTGKTYRKSANGSA